MKLIEQMVDEAAKMFDDHCDVGETIKIPRAIVYRMGAMSLVKTRYKYVDYKGKDTPNETQFIRRYG